ncbi:ChaN family lipoprotein [Flavobacterium sp. HSC-61S13]|uniref:ChaN family lipoprotein n=1 Tax=Flavobacterium sp. HSC-61S13 TaxID=2910963 RepID=UPI0020A0C214|nr:ChaN family lipoprotein [Flavobacterium sp. HSC-61S13]MCP1995259.1 putative iron-regulated protein [Flavobacterium sp. HSC-61S13]
MKQYIIALIIFISPILVQAQNPLPYVLYTKDGKQTNFNKLIKDASKKDVVLFGEFHDNSIVHWLQLKLAQALVEKQAVVFGAEMFEADNQSGLDKYLAGEVDQKGMDSLVRLWNNYKTDYKPLVDLAKNKNLDFFATNVPRRYASKVFKEGVESLDLLSDQEKVWMAPLPFPYDKNLPGYLKMMKMFEDHANDNLPKAQAIKDATMAYFIKKNHVPNTLFLHFNGSYHSDNYEGINWYLNIYSPDLKVLTISTVSQQDLSKLEKEHFDKADYIIVTDMDMTKTF